MEPIAFWIIWVPIHLFSSVTKLTRAMGVHMFCVFNAFQRISDSELYIVETSFVLRFLDKQREDTPNFKLSQTDQTMSFKLAQRNFIQPRKPNDSKVHKNFQIV